MASSSLPMSNPDPGFGLFDETEDEVRNIVRADPNYLGRMFELSVSRAERKHMLSKGLTKYRSRALADGDSLRTLQKHYPEFSIESGVAIDMTGHPYSRDSRYLDSKLVREIFITSKRNVVLHKAYDGSKFDVLIKDVGSNVSEVLRNEPLGTVHMCTPVFNSSDVSRYYSTQRYISDLVPKLVMEQDNGVARRYLKSLVKCDGIARCSLPSQYCTVTAPFVTFIHSSYDLTIEDVVKILDQAKANEAFFVFLFDPLILTSSVEGVIRCHNVHWRKFKVNNVSCIRFDFRDGQNSYIHRMDTYLALVGVSRITSPATFRSYVFSCHRFSNSTMYVRAVADVRTSVPSELVVRSIPLSDSDFDVIYIKTWRWDTLAAGDAASHMVPVILCCAREFWHRIITYGKSYCQQGKFTVSNLQQAAATFVSKLEVGGRSYSTGCDNAMDVSLIVLSAWVKIFIDNYEIGKAQQCMKLDEEAVRNFNESGAITRLLKTLTLKRVTKAKDSASAKHPIGDYLIDSASRLDKVYEIENSENHRSFYRVFYNFLFNSLGRVRKYPIEVTESVSVLSIENHLSPAINEMYDNYYPYFAKPGPKSEDDAIVDRMVMDSILTGSNEHVIAHSPPKTVPCDSRDMEPVAVPGDGNCFYHAFLELVEDDISVSDLKRRLSRSIHNRLDKAGRDTLCCSSGDGAWATNDIISLAAHEYKLCVCVHIAERCGKKCVRFNDSAHTIIHIQLKNNHFEPLVRKVTTNPLIKITLPDCDVFDGDNIEFTYVAYNSLVSKYCMNINANRVRHDMSLASTHYHKNCALNKCGYVSHYGVLLSTAVKTLPNLKSRMRVLDVNHTNGSSLHLFVDKLKATTCSVQFSCNSEYEPDGKYDKYQVGTHTDYTSLLENVEEFDIVSINPSKYCDELVLINEDAISCEIDRNLVFASKLRTGGSLLLGVPITMNERMMQVLTSCTKSFDSVSIVRSQFVPPHNPWVLIVCEGFNNLPINGSDIFKPIGSFVAMIRDQLDIPSAIEHIANACNTRIITGIDHCEYRAAMESVRIDLVEGGAVDNSIHIRLPEFSMEKYNHISFSRALKLHQKAVTDYLVSKLDPEPPSVLNLYWLSKVVNSADNFGEENSQIVELLYDVISSKRYHVRLLYNKFDYANGTTACKFMTGSNFSKAKSWLQHTFHTYLEYPRNAVTTIVSSLGKVSLCPVDDDMVKRVVKDDQADTSISDSQRRLKTVKSKLKSIRNTIVKPRGLQLALETGDESRNFVNSVAVGAVLKPKIPSAEPMDESNPPVDKPGQVVNEETDRYEVPEDLHHIFGIPKGVNISELTYM